MKLFDSFKRKAKFYYELTECPYIDTEKIMDNTQLIQHLDEENQRFHRDYLKSSVLVSKIRNNEAAEVVYAKRFNLPLPKDTDWNGELKEFFKKKPGPFEILEQEEHPKEPEEANVTEVNNFASSWNDVMFKKQASSPVQESLSFNKGEEESKNDPGLENNLAADETKRPSYNFIKDDQSNMEEPLTSPVSPLASEPEKRLNLGADYVEPSLDDLIGRATAVSFKTSSSLPAEGFEVENLETAQDFMAGFAIKARQMVLEFLEAENKKIYAEVASQDRRAEIPEKVRVQFEGEKEAMLYQKEQELLEELSSNIQAEEDRHKAALAAIKQENEAKRKSTAQSIQDSYAEKITLEVTKRFNKETQHLSNILEGKKSALAMRQTELTQGLESSFKETLSEVNRNQDKVLKDLSTLQQADNIIALQKQNVG
ncbi:hypothetical protein VNN41_11165 (plasmid) [Lactococcus garvieae]|uniref:hypothetical protein n=1 Tax=Lactococcus garvieae TaxID=1363 RepID=UPI00311B04D9